MRLNALVVATTAGGYYMAAPDGVSPLAIVIACVGTALVASGAAAFNQVSERDIDRLMERTRQRPLPEGRMTPDRGHRSPASRSRRSASCCCGWARTRWRPRLRFATLVIYVWIYTPLKRRSSLATIVGAVPGALPPLIGWAAARGSISGVAPWTLFLLMFLWQLPHFLAISWIYRDDYARAGLPMLLGGRSRRQHDRPAGGALGRDADSVQRAARSSCWRTRATRSARSCSASRFLVAAIKFAVRPHRRQRAAALLRIDHVPAAALGADLRRQGVTCDLPALNATLNATSAVLLTIGWFLHQVPPDSGAPAVHDRGVRHVRAVSDLLQRLSRADRIEDEAFPGTGVVRTIYFSILIPHVALAAVVLPLAIVTLRRGLRRDDARHRRLARWTLPIWLFVSVTGVIVYVMLYQLY